MRIRRVGVPVFLAVAAVFLALQACEGNGEVKTSKAGEDESHNHGKDCMKCHYKTGPGEGTWTVAGSAWNLARDGKYSGQATMKIYSEKGGKGKLYMSVPMDAKGNFYTSMPMDFKHNPAYVRIETASNTYEMPYQLVHGACNDCHGDGGTASRITLQ
ncbi:MAG: hypothetical protein JNL57_08670 [Bacteroidetes bacterium]|nr:hypothetical protein [Bacteroidota bacterium]